MGAQDVQLATGGEVLGVDLPGGGRVTREGVQRGVTGESILNSFLKDIPQLSAKDYDKAAQAAAVAEAGPGPTMFVAPMTKEEGYETVPEVLEGTDRLRHENDILFVTNQFLESGGRGVAEFAEWMHRQLAYAKMSGMVEPPNKWAPPVPEVEALAKYLRMASQHVRRS